MRLLAVLMAGLLVGTGCVSNSYQIPTSELQRLSHLPPEHRAQRVAVSQEVTATEVTPAERVSHDTQIVFIPGIHVGVGGSYSPGRRRGYDRGHVTAPAGRSGGGGKGLNVGDGAKDGKGAAIAFLVLAAVALVAIAAVEGSRFDGHVELHPMHPVHLFGKDGSRAVMPLAWIDPQAAAFTETAVIRPSEGPWRQLDRNPLTRRGTYGMYGGYGSTRSAYGDVEFGPSFTVQAGYFPEQHVGLLATVSLGWRDNRAGGTLLDSRYMAELQAMPVQAGPLHAGLYVGAGLAYRWEDVVGGTITGNNGSTAFTGGAMLQLDVHTRIALTARLGAVKAHGDRTTDMMFGLSVY
jgi:hypothetical protein